MQQYRLPVEAKAPRLVETLGAPHFYCDGLITRDCGDVVRILGFISYPGELLQQSVALTLSRGGFRQSFVRAAGQWLPLFAAPDTGRLTT